MLAAVPTHLRYLIEDAVKSFDDAQSLPLQNRDLFGLSKAYLARP